MAIWVLAGPRQRWLLYIATMGAMMNLRLCPTRRYSHQESLCLWHISPVRMLTVQEHRLSHLLHLAFMSPTPRSVNHSSHLELRRRYPLMELGQWPYGSIHVIRFLPSDTEFRKGGECLHSHLARAAAGSYLVMMEDIKSAYDSRLSAPSFLDELGGYECMPMKLESIQPLDTSKFDGYTQNTT